MNGFATLCATLRRYVQHFVTIVLAQEKMTKIRVRKNPEKKNKIPGTTTVRTKCFQIREVLREVLQSVPESLDLLFRGKKFSAWWEIWRILAASFANHRRKRLTLPGIGATSLRRSCDTWE